jgi:hypothetical protein
LNVFLIAFLTLFRLPAARDDSVFTEQAKIFKWVIQSRHRGRVRLTALGGLCYHLKEFLENLGIQWPSKLKNCGV